MLGETRLITVMRRCCLLFELVGPRNTAGGHRRRRWTRQKEVGSERSRIWMDGCLGCCMDGVFGWLLDLLDGWMCYLFLMDCWMHDKYIFGCLDRLLDGWMNGCMHGWMDVGLTTQTAWIHLDC